MPLLASTVDLVGSERSAARCPLPRRRSTGAATAVAVALGAAGAFLAISWLIDGGRQKRGTRFDRAVLRWVGGARPPASHPFVQGLSFLGSLPAALTGAGAALLIARPGRRGAGQIVAGACGGIIAEVGLKRVFRRRRPAIVEHLAKVTSTSFPSGHSMTASSFYLTLALLAARHGALREHRGVLVGGAALLASAIGATRVYLGVHWPTDVLAGLALGTAWASAAEAVFDAPDARCEVKLDGVRASRRIPGVRPRAALVFNPAAGCAGGGIGSIQEALAERFELDVHELTGGQEAASCLEKALAGRPEIVIAGGGDGTTSMVAHALAGTGVTLGVLPLGTSNSIAASLGIPGEATSALAALFDGETRALDTAEANGRTMMLHASIGLHATTIGNTPSDAKQRWGALAYLREAVTTMRDVEPFDVELTLDDAIVRCRATSVMVANMAPPKTVLAQGTRVASPEDGYLDITIVSATSLAEAVVTGMHLFRTAVQKECADRDNIGFLSARSVRIVTSPAQRILIDGEEAGAGELVVRCRPHSLRVRVPRDREVVVAAPHERKLSGLPDLDIVPRAIDV